MKPYFCHDRPRPAPGLRVWVQDGWITEYVAETDVTVQVAKMVQIPFVNSTSCMYDRASEDSRCADCKEMPDTE